MSLATRCASCGTVFRVVQDQLRVSSGWVRCGRCGEVFDAIESLVDMAAKPTIEPSTISPNRLQPPAGTAASARSRSSPVRGPADEQAAEAALQWRSEANAAESSPPPSPPEPAVKEAPAVLAALPEAATASVASAPDLPPQQRNEATEASEAKEAKEAEFAPTEVPVSMFPPTGFVDYAAEHEIDSPALDAAKGAGDSVAEHDADEPLPQIAETPAFVARAERAARWRHPRVRLILGVALFGAVVGLAWQSLLSHHDWFAARWPVLKPVVARACIISACEIKPPLQIEALSVDSSALTKTTINGQYALAITLRNRSAMDVRVPSLELTLTDAMGQMSVRRVLTPAELGVERDAISGQGELNIAARLRVDSAPVVGYTIDLFYP